MHNNSFIANVSPHPAVVYTIIIIQYLMRETPFTGESPDNPTQIRTNFNMNYYLATLSNNLSKQSWVLLDLILSKNGQFMKNSNHRKLSTDYRQNLRSYQNLTVIQMALKKLHLAPWIRWYPWTERASADLSLWAANDIHFQTTIINDEIVHDYDENWLSIYGSSSTMGWNIF